VAGLPRGRAPIGAGRGRGYGRVELSDMTIRRANLSDPAGLITWLTGTAPTVAPAEPGGESPADGRLGITIAWRPVGPLLVRDSVSGTVVDTLPLTDTAADGSVRLLLPGSSIRGAVRAHAERIVRTLQRQDAPDHFVDALRQPPPGVDVLFGSAPSGTSTDGASKGWRGVLTVADCHSLGRVSAEAWNEIVALSPDPVARNDRGEREERGERNNERDRARSALAKKLDDVHGAFALKVSDHVAIDRWTGGASDHRLFSVLDPDSTVAWEPIRIEVDVSRLDRHGASGETVSASMALPLLLLVLRDLRDGWLSFGYGGTRGRGQIEVTGVTFDGAGMGGPWQALAGQDLDSILTDPPPEVLETMTTWENAFQEVAA
ncbi:MAG TPA: RAMP superfamily CRISPR-associated protein, partial [Micromonospora sp.]